MNFQKLIYSFLILSLITACSPSEKTAETAEETTETKSEIELAWDEVMVVHDEVMPKMGNLNRLKKQLMQDSVNNAELIEKIAAAGDGMMDWMHGLTPYEKVKAMPEAEAKAYLEKEMTSIAEVKRQMLESIEAAEQVLQNSTANEN